ncbi:hypothetical protein [Streptomyces somaliensis]|uniref:hypothetical protein n=1 Tax=Streptomyces somaliensis TaxID=78355 RepID=UPI0034E95D02|nr:hypothetical protein [Streptomyces somaliensis]
MRPLHLRAAVPPARQGLGRHDRGGLFSAGRSGSGAECRKDRVPVVNCPYCRGQRGKTCGTCGGTGQTCPVHGRFWT